MASEETVQLIKTNNVIGEKSDLPVLNPSATLTGRTRAMSTKMFGVPQLIHLYGALGLNSTLTLASGENTVTCMFSDGTFLYAGMDTSPAKIVKVDLSTFTEYSTLTLDSGQDVVRAMVSDGTYLYVGLRDSPSRIVKVNLETFLVADTITLADDQIFLESLFSDGASLFVGTSSAGTVKIDLTTFEVVNTLTVVGETNTNAMYSDGINLYAGIYSAPGQIQKINRNTFGKIETLDLDTGEDYPTSFFSGGSYLYCGLDTSPGKVVKVDISSSSFSQIDTLTFATGENQIRCLFCDATFLYAGLYTSPGKIVMVDLATFTIVDTITLDTGSDYVNAIFSDGNYIYFGLGNSPGKIVKLYVIPSSDSHQRKIDLIHEQMSSGIWSIYPSNSAGVQITSAAGAYTKGNYAEVIPASTIRTQFQITGLVSYALTANTDYVYDIAVGGAGSEVIVGTSSVLISSNQQQYETRFIPSIKIPANSRVAIRSSDATGGLTSRTKIRYRSPRTVAGEIPVPPIGAAPTFVQEIETTWDIDVVKTTANFNVQAGDVLVAFAISESGSFSLNSPTGTLTATWTLRQSYSGDSGYTDTRIWTASIASNQTGKNVDFSCVANVAFGGSILIFRGSNGIGVSNKAHASTGLPSLTLTGISDNSAIVVVNGDWDAVDGAARGYTVADAGAFTETTYNYTAGTYTTYGGYHANAGSAGNKTVGLTAPAGQKWVLLALEVLGT